MQTITKQQILKIANELAQQQDDYFEGFVIDKFNIVGGVFDIGAKGLNDDNGKLSTEKLDIANKIFGKIAPILRSEYIIVD